jgi:hypothetical protein
MDVMPLKASTPFALHFLRVRHIRAAGVSTAEAEFVEICYLATSVSTDISSNTEGAYFDTERGDRHHMTGSHCM